jgi:hypothetical protein
MPHPFMTAVPVRQRRVPETSPVPWVGIAVLVAATVLASLAVAAWPSRKAARFRPAVALRVAD